MQNNICDYDNPREYSINPGDEMIRFIVMVKHPSGKIDGLGSHEFAVAPRTGEYVTMNDEEVKGQAYRVKAVVHPLDLAMDAGDLILDI